ncbi:hypothetical protein F5Y05DRAFT_86787 [Hypoxylon sp. FL0543]|nr:hypothetical protein F5Y05DRAFT_86787 [Hypoxylon sp. FL0543]
MDPAVEGELLADPPRLTQSNTSPWPSTVADEVLPLGPLASEDKYEEIILSLKAEISSLQEDLRLAHSAIDDILADLSSTQNTLELQERSNRTKDLEIQEWQRKVETLEKSLDARPKPQLPSTMGEDHMLMRDSAEILELNDKIKKLEASLKEQVSINEDHLEKERTLQTQLDDQRRDHKLQVDQLEANIFEQETRRKEAETRATELQGSQTTLERRLSALKVTSQTPQGDSNAHVVNELRRLVDFYKANSERASRQAQKAFAMRGSSTLE